MVDRGLNLHFPAELVFNPVNCLSVGHSSEIELPASFSPSPWTVICGRGKNAFNHVGSRRFRILCEVVKDKYENAASKAEKGVIVSDIIDTIRKANSNEPTGNFVRWEQSRKMWIEITDIAARDKVGQCLRDLTSKDKSDKSVSEESEPRKRRRLSGSSMSTYSTTSLTTAVSYSIKSGGEPAPVQRLSRIGADIEPLNPNCFVLQDDSKEFWLSL